MTLSELRARSHVPYSGRASCALTESESGDLFPGVRVESISFPLTISAARGALFHCLSEGHNPRKIYVEEDRTEQAETWHKEFGLQLLSLDDLPSSHDNPERPEDPPVSCHNSIIPEVASVVDLLADLHERAVVPHSAFPVSVLLQSDRGWFGGVNLECGDWSRGLCGERVAVAKALASGAKHLHSLHIYARDGEFSSPCGACRQVLAEQMYGGRVCLYHSDKSRSDFYVRDLLPYGFHASSLKKEKE